MRRIALWSICLLLGGSLHAFAAWIYLADQGWQGRGGDASFGSGGQGAMQVSIAMPSPAPKAGKLDEPAVEKTTEPADATEPAPEAARKPDIVEAPIDLLATLPAEEVLPEIKREPAKETPKTPSVVPTPPVKARPKQMAEVVQKPKETQEKVTPNRPVELSKPAPAKAPEKVAALVDDQGHAQGEDISAPMGGNGTNSAPMAAGQGGGNVAGSAALASVKNAYAEVLRGWVERHKQYPRAARLRRLQGRGMIEITINRQGSVVAAGLVKRTGATLLDKELVALPGRASPFPAIPTEIGGDKMTFTVPIRFGS